MSDDFEPKAEPIQRDTTILGLLSAAEAEFNLAQLEDNLSRIEIVDGVINKVPRQMEKVREDQIVNNAGGYVFKVDDETRIRRFLILGSASGSYHQTSEKMTMDNANAMIEIIEDGKAYTLLKELSEINAANRNPKASPVLFTLALCARYHVSDVTDKDQCKLIETYAKYIHEMHNAAFALVPEVCRIPTHLFEFVGYCEAISKSTNMGKNSSSGWGRLMRRTISRWYTSKTAEKLAMLLTKYPQREGWSHRDLFRLSHPQLKNLPNIKQREDRLELEQIFRFAVKGDLLPRKRRAAEPAAENDKQVYTNAQLDKELNSRPLDLIETYLKLKHEKSEEIIVEAIKNHGLVREHLPTDALNSKAVWETLFDIRMPMTAMIRNLAKMSVVGCLNEERIRTICTRLTDQKELKKARIHPLNLLIARAVYSQGRGDKGSLTWEPNEEICKALEQGFYKAFVNAPSTGKRYMLALDVSGSMGSRVSDSPLSCRDAATAMSLINLHNELSVQCVAFCDELVELPFTKEWDIDRVNNYIQELRFGATDCGLPMTYAAEKNLEIDVFIIYTDNDTWAGEIHPFEAIQQYREKSGIRDARVIVMGMQAYEFSIADPNDKGMLDVTGFDSAVPAIVHEFVMGNI